MARGVLVRLGMGWFWCPDHSQEPGANENVYVHRVHLEADQCLRSMKLSLAAYNTENSAAVGAWVLLEPSDAEQARGTVGGGGQNSQLEGSEAGGERPTVSTRGER